MSNTQFVKPLAFLFAAILVCMFLAPTRANCETVAGAGADLKTSVPAVPGGRPPVVVIPGLTGSELINKETGAKVWFNLGRFADDDLRLPVSPRISANRDALAPGDILRKIKLIRFVPEIEIYQSLIGSLEKGGYREASIDEPAESAGGDVFYVFPYDWRRDNVENARLLLDKLDLIRTNSRRPDLRFDIVAHSMGGLIARYAAMYGRSDVSPGRKRPDWKTALYFNRIVLLGTPNGGSMESLNSLINGFDLFGVGRFNIPFVRNMSKFDLFTIPSMFQLIPADGLVRAFDSDLNPVKIDVFDPAVWEEYGWTAYSDREFAGEFNVAEQKAARAYFRAVLLRAKLFREALSADRSATTPVPIYYLGAECKATLDGIVLFRDPESKNWTTIFDAGKLVGKAGNKFSKAQIEKVLSSPGDGVVAKTSLLFDSAKDARVSMVCGDHNRLMGNPEIEKDILQILNAPDVSSGN